MKTIVWPVYIDSTKTRGQGRKISRKNSVKSPKIGEISRAARKLKLNPETESKKSYPGLWWDYNGRVLVNREEETKIEVLVKISQEIQKTRNK